MSRFLRTACAAALAAAAFGAVASTAQAQTYNRLVVFGDSLSDNGNLYALTGQPTSPPYYQGRFSNGPVFTELLGFNAGRYTAGAPVTGSVNYAFGGARTDSSALPPGMRNQLLAYTGAGGTFGANDLVSVLGGANNIFQQMEAFAALPGGDPQLANPIGFVAPAALSAAADMNFIVNDIATRGAGTIMVSNLPNLALTPQFLGTAGAPLADYAGKAFNGALLTGMMSASAAHPDTNIILVDLYKVGATLSGDPGRFGLTNVTDRCFNGVTVCANPDSYLYWDGVHPTAAGHRLLAALADDYLYYGDIGAQSTVQAETGYRQREDLLDMSTQALSSRAAWTSGTQMTFDVIADSAKTDTRGVVAGSDTTGWGARAGLDHAMSENARFGFAASFREADIEAGSMALTARSYGFDLYAGWRSGNTFVNATAGASIDQYDDITRVTTLAPIAHVGETDGGSLGARLQGGMWFDMGGLSISPRAALSYVSTDVNGYNERGAAAEYAYQDRTLAAASGEIALRAEGGGERMNFFVEGGYRDTFADSSDAVRVGIADNPAQILSHELDNPFGGAMLASAGVQATFGPVKMSISYRGRFGDDAESHLGAITFKLPL